MGARRAWGWGGQQVASLKHGQAARTRHKTQQHITQQYLPIHAGHRLPSRLPDSSLSLLVVLRLILLYVYDIAIEDFSAAAFCAQSNICFINKCVLHCSAPRWHHDSSYKLPPAAAKQRATATRANTKAQARQGQATHYQPQRTTRRGRRGAATTTAEHPHPLQPHAHECTHALTTCQKIHQ